MTVTEIVAISSLASTILIGAIYFYIKAFINVRKRIVAKIEKGILSLETLMLNIDADSFVNISNSKYQSKSLTGDLIENKIVKKTNDKKKMSHMINRTYQLSDIFNFVDFSIFKINSDGLAVRWYFIPLFIGSTKERLKRVEKIDIDNFNDILSNVNTLNLQSMFELKVLLQNEQHAFIERMKKIMFK